MQIFQNIASRIQSATHSNAIRMGIVDGYSEYSSWEKDLQYSGEFKGGHYHGYGTLNVLPERITFFRSFPGMDSFRLYDFSFNQGYQYRGHFQFGLFDGLGLLTCGTDRYEGEFQKGMLHGQGVLTYETGERYEGEFENNTFHGKGILTHEDGTRYKGRFQNGMFHGLGVLTNADGSKAEGEFLNGTLANIRIDIRD